VGVSAQAQTTGVIKPGETAQAIVVSTSQNGDFSGSNDPNYYQWYITRPGGDGIADYVTPKTWGVTAAGQIAVPANAAVGEYAVSINSNYFHPTYAPTGLYVHTTKSLQFNIVSVTMVNPSGDPTTAGEHKQGNTANNYTGNEFTFDDSTAGVLTIRCEAGLYPNNAITQAWAAQNVTWTVDDVGGSTKTWHDTPDGVETDNKGLVVYCRFKKLPANYDDFGTKEVKMTAQEVDTTRNIEVFYTAEAANYPGLDPNHVESNWFHYYKQNEGGADYTFDPIAETSHTPPGKTGQIMIARNAYSGIPYLITQVVDGQLTVTGVSPVVKYYADFIGTLAHEREHATHQVPMTDPSDTDHDWLPSQYEIDTTNTKPNQNYSARGILEDARNKDEFVDGEVYAHKVGAAAMNSADKSQDWAFPGSNSAYTAAITLVP